MERYICTPFTSLKKHQNMPEEQNSPLLLTVSWFLTFLLAKGKRDKSMRLESQRSLMRSVVSTPSNCLQEAPYRVEPINKLMTKHWLETQPPSGRVTTKPAPVQRQLASLPTRPPLPPPRHLVPPSAPLSPRAQKRAYAALIARRRMVAAAAAVVAAAAAEANTSGRATVGGVSRCVGRGATVLAWRESSG